MRGGGVSRSSLHGLETRMAHDGQDMNAWKFGERTIVWTWAQESLEMNARKIFVRS